MEITVNIEKNENGDVVGTTLITPKGTMNTDMLYVFIELATALRANGIEQNHLSTLLDGVFSFDMREEGIKNEKDNNN